MKKYLFSSKGQALIEIMVAFSVAMVIVAAVTSLILSSLSGAQLTKSQSLAQQYAQSAKEIVRSMRDNDYATFSSLGSPYPAGTPYCLAKICSSIVINPADPNYAVCGPKSQSASSCSTPNIDNKFIRTVTVTTNDPSCLNGTPTVSPSPSPPFTAPPNPYGFNTHVSASNSILNLTTFKQNVDDLVLHNQQWIRFNIIDSEIVDSITNPTTINWDSANLNNTYDSAINYARSKGLKIFLVTNVASLANSYSFSDYQTVTKTYYDFLANRYKGKIDVWQVFNEVNVHEYNNYNVDPRTDATLGSYDSYLTKLNTIIGIANTSIKAADSLATVTTNTGGYPYNTTLRTNWTTFFDKLSSSLDTITVDIYPDNSDGTNGTTNEIANIASNITSLQSRYGKPVAVGETGMCTGDGRFTEANQATYVTQYIQNAKTGGATIILPYEIQDEASYPSPPPSYQWGINWVPFPIGTYYLAVTGVTPQASPFIITIQNGQTTQITYNVATATIDTQYFTGGVQNGTGLLRVTTNPATAATLTVTSTTACDVSLGIKNYLGVAKASYAPVIAAMQMPTPTPSPTPTLSPTPSPTPAASSPATKISVMVKWADAKCTDPNNVFCHQIVNDSCLTDVNRLVAP